MGVKDGVAIQSPTAPALAGYQQPLPFAPISVTLSPYRSLRFRYDYQ